MRWTMGLLWVAGCSAAPAEVGSPTLPRVLVASVEQTAIPGGVLHGVTRSVGEAELAFVSGGRVVGVDVSVGQHVEAGQVLVRQDATPLRARLAALDAQLAQAAASAGQRARDAERGVAMSLTASVSDAELEGLATADAVAQAALDALRSQRREVVWLLSQATLTAPFAGVVAACRVDVGDVAGAGLPVVSLRTPDAVEVSVQVPERWVDDLSVGEAVQVRFPLAGREPVDGRIVHLSDAASEAGLFEAEVSLASQGVRSGYTVEVWLPSARDALRVPATALVAPSGESPRVRRVRRDTVLEVPVTVLGVDGDGVFVDGPLMPGETVVWSGHTGLVDGDRVEVMP